MTLLENYLNHLEIEKNYSPLTRRNYERCLSTFIKFAKIRTIDDLSLEKIHSFRLRLARQKAQNGEYLKKNTQAYYVIVIRNFLKYLAKSDIKAISAEKIELPKMTARQIDIIKYMDLEKLLESPRGKDIKSLRDKAILEMFFSTGLRLAELCRLDRYLDLDRGEISIRGKGDRLRMVFISDRAKKAVKEYLAQRSDTDPALFISLAKSTKQTVIGRITPRCVQRLIIFHSRKTGIGQHVTPHQLRHQFATDLLMNGADIRSVQELLGHRNIATTQIYTHVTNQHLKEVHQTFHARRRK